MVLILNDVFDHADNIFYVWILRRTNSYCATLFVSFNVILVVSASFSITKTLIIIKEINFDDNIIALPSNFGISSKKETSCTQTKTKAKMKIITIK